MSPIMSTILSEGPNQSGLYWDIPLDQDLLETIVNIYPEWFKENSLQAMTEGNADSLIPFLQSIPSDSPSPPQVDNQSLKNTMDKNKESLKVKLMLRRPINQLIEQGIHPPLGSSPVFHHQKQRLERAKTGDYLKHKIQSRPQREELIQQHILEDTTVDPSLHEKQRQLKKARLADDLNDRLSHRPGPLELIKGNILHTDEQFELAVKEGQIPFKNTCEGEVVKHPPPRFVFANEEESSSDSAASPVNNNLVEQALNGLVTFEATPDVPVVPTATVVATTCTPTNVSYIVSTPVTNILTSPSTVHSILIGNGNAVAIATPSPIPSVVTVAPGTTAPIINATPFCPTTNQISVSLPVVSSFKEHSSSSKNRKKSKSKAQPKPRTIKFHEYKGPPNAKNQPNPDSAESAESSYELLLQQQQLFLQWQLEWQQKYPQIILPTAQKTSLDQIQDQGTDAQNSTNTQNNPKSASTQNIIRNSFPTKPNNPNVTNNDSNGSVGSPRDRSNSNTSMTGGSKFNSSVVGKLISKLEDMKVSDLKAELKKRNLPVSGPKQQLIDRLKPFVDAVMASAIANSTFFTINSPNGMISPENESKSIVKTESACESVPMSPNIVMSSPVECVEPKTEPMDIKSPDNVMEVDSIAEDGDQNCSMELGTDGSLQTSDDIVLIQQKKISELQSLLQKSQMQLHLQQTSAVPMDTQTIVSAPQIHIISTPNTELSVDGTTQKSLQRQLLQQHLQQKLQQNLNLKPQTINNETNLATLLTNGTISPSVKASLAAFLQSQHQLQQQNQGLTTKLITTQNVTPIQQIVLCPTICATNDNMASQPESGREQRTNSLPNGLSHKFLTQTSLRTASLPNFNSILPNHTNVEQKAQVKPSVMLSKCPPNYDEATKQMNKTKDKKKSIKSQAVDDVLEILIKNGELPPSAAHDPTTPTTPDKLLSLKSHTNPLFSIQKNPQKSCELNQTEALRPVNTNDSNNNINNDNNYNNNINNNKLIVNNNNSVLNNKLSAQNNATLDFDFILDLEGLAEAMDLNVAINEKSLKPEKLNNNNSYQTQCNQSLSKNNTNNELSLSEFMDFQECNLNVEDNHWLGMASTSRSSAEQNMLDFNETDEQNHSNINFDNNNNNSQSNCGQTSSSLVGCTANKSEASKHDPILPNTMFGGSVVDPLGDLFFDDTDFKSTLDLGSLIWDKVDFAT